MAEFAGIAPSMGSVGDAYDDALAESFFASLETELIDRSRWADPAEARQAVFHYIEVSYDRTRRHSAPAICRPRSREEVPSRQDACCLIRDRPQNRGKTSEGAG